MFGNLDNNTDIIIYVSEEYKNKIIDNNLINDKVKIEIFDFRKVKYNKLLLSQLDLPILQNYDKVLYLDIYSIINDDISRLFDTINNDEIYTNGPDDGNISTPIAFLLYRNNETTRTFFDRVEKDMNKMPTHILDTKIIPNLAKKTSLLNTSLNSVVSIKPFRPANNITIAQYPEDPNRFTIFPTELSDFFMFAKEFKIKPQLENSLKYFNENLLEEWKKYNVGNDLIIMKSTGKAGYNLAINNQFKQISALLLNNNIKRVLIIGIDAGIVPILMNNCNKKCEISYISLDNEDYSNKYSEIIKIDNMKSIKIDEVCDTYDIVYIDAKAEIDNILEVVKKVSKNKTIVCMTNCELPEIKSKWNEYCSTNKLLQLQGCNYVAPNFSNMIVKL
jgi:hypothetical protein